MSRLGLRTRLVLVSALAVALAVAVTGIAFSLITAHELRASLDSALRDRAAEVARLSASAPAVLSQPGALDEPLGGRQLSVQVVDSRGRIVARSASLGGKVLPGGALQARALGRGRPGYAETRLGEQAIRLYAAPLARTGGPASGGAVLVASTTAEIDRTLSRLRTLLVLSAVGAALLGALAVALMTQRGLLPLRRLASAAREVERTGDPGRRLPVPPARDELGELAETLNRMLSSLERARETERRFLADASHELRTPLTALRGNAAYVARHGADREALADLERDAARLGALLDSLLALEREEAAARPREPVRLDDIAREQAREAGAELAHVEPLAVPGERPALAGALRNLLENARLHGPAGGAVTVSLERDGDMALLSVADEGPGIRPAQVGRALGRFWRGAEARERPGSGLGLAIVAATAERHGGRVTVEGSRVTLHLPIVRDLSRPGPNVAPATEERSPA